jgi:signal transduction histidine kinase/FixJ family two-component response regulator
MKGTPVYKEEDLVIYKKYDADHDLETYFNWRYVPIATRDGKNIGFFNQATDSTDKVLAERRLGTVREMSEQLLVARTMREYYDSIEEVLRQNPRDAPFVMCYSVTQKEKLGNAVGVEAKLECSVGVPEEHSSKVPTINLTIPVKTRFTFGTSADRLSSPTLSAISALSSGSGRQYIISNDSSWPIQKAIASRQSVIVEDCRDLVQGFPIRAWDELPYAAAVVPICSDNSTELPEAVMIIGLNVRRPLDVEYDAWIHLVRSQMASSLLSVKAYEAEQRRLDDTLRMEKAKTAWFRGAAHDLRSPLTLVKGPIEDLLGSDLNPGQKHHAMTAKRNVDRLLRLVNALLDFSRLEAGRVKAKFVPINLGEWVRDLAEVFRAAVERMGIKYNIDVDAHDALVYVDPTLFETVISNLISNALKYTEQGSIQVRVRVDDHAEVSIADTGFGIPKDEVEHVTDWYHRATTAVHAGTQGSGLGLALAKELVKLHEGELKVTSQTKAESGGPHGSTFTVSIPITQHEQHDATDHVELGQYGKELAKEAMRWTRGGGSASASSEGGEGESSGGSGSMSRLTDGLLFEPTDVILLVDDNVDMREYIKGIFKRHCLVLEARDGQEALEIVRARRPNLILTDFMMPKMNGLELLAEIRENDATRLIPVILLSAMQGDEVRVDALFMGAEDYIEKPFKPKELVARCHLHMQVGKKRVKLEAGFAERTAEIALLSDYCPTGIMRASAEGVVTYANDAWRRMAGMLREEEAANWPKYVTPETVTALLGPWSEFLSGEHRELKLQWKWLTGSIVEGLFIRLDLFGEGLTGILGCITDITYQEQRVVEAEQRRREAEESKQQQELLIDLTSHEIRTPVSAILQCSSLVKENLVALKEQLKWTGGNGFMPTKELLHDLEEDVEALESKAE